MIGYRAMMPKWFAASQHNPRKGKKMDNITKKDAQSLAIAYAAYVQATLEGNKNSEIVWAHILNDAQNATGISMVSDVILKHSLTRAA